MKVSQKIISLVLILTMAMGLATTPSFAASENTEYENSLKSGWGSSTSNFQYPSAYNTSWNRQVINFIDLVATRTQNIYSRLGDMSSTLINISSNTSYIQSISQHFNVALHSGWGDSSSYFTVPSGMRGSWYGAALMLLDNIQQRLSEPLDLELDPTTSAILENISTNSGIIATNSVDISTKTGSILNQFSVTSPINFGYNYRNSVYDSYSYDSPVPGNQNGFFIFQQSYASNMRYFRNVNSSNFTLQDYLYYQLRNLYSLESELFTPRTRYQKYFLNDDLSVPSTQTSFGSLADFLFVALDQWDKPIKSLAYILADSDTIAAKQANKQQENNVLSNFTGSGSASASINDFTGVKDSVSALKTSLSGGASYTQAFNILSGDSDGWSWFSNEVAESMDSTNNGNTRLRSVPDSTTYLDSYYSELSSYLGYSYNGGIE